MTRGETAETGVLTRRRVLATVALALAAVWLVLVPVAVVEGFGLLVAFGFLATGATATVGRAGMVDLSLGGVAGLGAYAGGVGLTGFGVPPLVALPVGAIAGGLAGLAVGAVLGRVGRTTGALASLAIGTAVVAALTHWPGGGGAAGYHAVPLLSGSARADLAILGAALVAALALVGYHVRSRAASVAALAAASPAVTASLGVSAVRGAAVTTGIAGGVVGLGGAALAVATGSVSPAGFAIPLAGAIALAGLLGGAPPWGPLLAALVVWGPSVLGAGVPGDASGLLVGGIAGVAILAVRRGAPLRPMSPRAPHPRAAGLEATGRRGGPARLSVEGSPLPRGGDVSFEVGPGEIVAVVGPNGSGKSTLLARISGHLPDAGTVSFRGRPAPRGARRRARGGVARTWQREVTGDGVDAERVAVATDDDGRAHGRAAAIVGRGQTSDLLALAARRPAVALLDEPGAQHPPAVVGALLRHLAREGAAVVVAEHRPEIVALADRVIRIGSDRG